MTKQRERYLETLIEAIANELTQIHEAVSLLADVPSRLSSLEEKFDRMSREHELFSLSLKDINKHLNNHEFRITKLETA